MIFSKIKLILISSFGVFVTMLLVAVKILTTKNSQLRRKVETGEAKIHHAKVVEVEKQKTEVELRSRTADLVKEIKEKGTSDELEDPNKW